MRPRRTTPEASCLQVREALSAARDGEQSPLAAGAVASHLASCPVCQEFDAAVASFTAGARLRVPRPVPAGLVARLEPSLPPAGAVAWPRRLALALPRAVERSQSVLRRSVWAAPAAALAIALPLGLGSTAPHQPRQAPGICSPDVLNWAPGNR